MAGGNRAGIACPVCLTGNRVQNENSGGGKASAHPWVSLPFPSLPYPSFYSAFSFLLSPAPFVAVNISALFVCLPFHPRFIYPDIYIYIYEYICPLLSPTFHLHLFGFLLLQLQFYFCSPQLGFYLFCVAADVV